MTRTPPIPDNFDALSELLKLTNNIIRFYPHSSSDEWDEKLDPLLWPTLALFHSLPTIDHAPPLTHCIHVLFAIPFIPRLLDTWHSVPVDSTPSDIGGTFKGFLDRIGDISITSNPFTTTAAQKPTGTPAMKNAALNSASSISTSTTHRTRRISLPAKKNDPTAFVEKVIHALERYIDKRLPWPQKPDGDQLENGVPIDEHLPPIFLLLARAAEGSEPSRSYLKEMLLPSDL